MLFFKKKFPKRVLELETSLFVLLCILLVFLVFWEFNLGFRVSTGIFAGVSSAVFLLYLVFKKTIILPRKISFLFILFIAGFLVSSFFSKVINVSIWESLRIISCFLVFLLAYNLNLRLDIRNKNIYVFSILLGAVSTFQFIEFVFSGLPGQGKSFMGSFFWHNQMAGFLIYPIFFSIYCFVSIRNFYLKLLFSSVFLIASTALLLTFSRGGYISVLSGLVFVIYHYRKKIKLKSPTALVGFIISFFILFFIARQSQFIDTAADLGRDIFSQNKTVSGSLRISVFQGSFMMISENPVFGVGPGAFGYAYYYYQKAPWLYAKNSHNHILQTFAETGIISGSIFIILLFIMLRSVLSSEKSLSTRKNVFLSGAILASLVHSLVDYDFSLVSLYGFFWTVSGITVSFRKVDNYKIAMYSNAKILFAPLLCFMFLAALLMFAEREYQKAFYEFKTGSSYENTAKMLDFAGRLNPFDTRVYSLKANLYFKQKDFENALMSLERSISLSPYDSNLVTDIAKIYFVQGDIDRAIDEMKLAVDLNKYSSPYYYNFLADLYISEDRLKEAEFLLEEAVYKRFPLNSSYRDFEYIYDSSGLKVSLYESYAKLSTVKIMLGKKEESRKIIEYMKKNLIIRDSILRLN